MAAVKKMLDQLLDEAGKEILISGDIVVDKASGKTLAEHIADTAAHRSVENLEELISSKIEPLETTVNTFLSGDPDDNGAIDRLKELVAAIEDNKDSIDDLLASNGTGIAIVDSAEAAPEYTGKIRMVVTEYTPSAGE